MEKIRLGVEMEFKGLRIYLFQLFVVLFLLPFSYLFIMLLSGKGKLTTSQIAFLLTGYMVVTLISAFINMLSLRVVNTKEPQVLELYSTFSITFPQIILSQSLTYVILTLPIVLLTFIYVSLSLKQVNILLLAFGIIFSILVLLLLSISLGLIMNNLFLANGVLQILSVILIIFSPAYFDANTLNRTIQILLLLNPVTHILNILRSPLAISANFDILWSYGILFVLSIALILFILRRVRRTYILEKIF